MMAKTMARLTENVVANLILCPDGQAETSELRTTGEYPVRVGDSYSDGKWLRDGEEILTPMEEENARLRAENEDMMAALETIYSGVSV